MSTALKRQLAYIDSLAMQRRERGEPWRPVDPTPEEIDDARDRTRYASVNKGIRAIISAIIGSTIFIVSTVKWGLAGMIIGGNLAGLLMLMILATPWAVTLAVLFVGGGLVVTAVDQATHPNAPVAAVSAPAAPEQ